MHIYIFTCINIHIYIYAYIYIFYINDIQIYAYVSYVHINAHFQTSCLDGQWTKEIAFAARSGVEPCGSHVDAMRIWESNTPKTCSANLNRPQVKTWNVWHGRHIAHPQTHQLTPTLEIHRNLDFFMWRNSKICTLDLALPRRCIPEAVHPSCPPCVWESPPKKTMVRSESFPRLWLGVFEIRSIPIPKPFLYVYTDGYWANAHIAAPNFAEKEIQVKTVWDNV